MSLIDEGKFVDNGRVNWLVVDGLVPTSDVGVLGTPLLVEEELEATRDDASSEEISKGDTFTGKVGVVKKVIFDNADCLESGLGRILNILLVVWVAAYKRSEPTTEGSENLGVKERHPLENRSVTAGSISMNFAVVKA